MEGFVEFLRRVESGEFERKVETPPAKPLEQHVAESRSWDSVADRYKVGTHCTGRITNVVDYGAFVEVEKGLSGLIHRSHINCGGRDNPAEFFFPGQSVDLVVDEVDSEKKRLSFAYDAGVGNEQNLAQAKSAGVLVDTQSLIGVLGFHFTGVICLLMEMLGQAGVEAKLFLPRDIRQQMEQTKDEKGLQFLQFLKTNKREAIVLPHDGEDYDEALVRLAGLSNIHIVSRRLLNDKTADCPWVRDCTSGKRRIHPCVWSVQGAKLPTLGLAMGYQTKGARA